MNISPSLFLRQLSPGTIFESAFNISSKLSPLMNFAVIMLLSCLSETRLISTPKRRSKVLSMSRIGTELKQSDPFAHEIDSSEGMLRMLTSPSLLKLNL